MGQKVYDGDVALLRKRSRPQKLLEIMKRGDGISEGRLTDEHDNAIDDQGTFWFRG